MLEFKGDIFLNKGTYINLNGFMARLMGQRCMNERVKLDNGNVARLYDSIDAMPAAKQITKLFAAQKERNASFLYVLAPTEIPKYENLLPAGYRDFSNKNGDELLALLRENGVPVLDLREEMARDGLRHTEAFFTTDHHWKPETGFWAYTKIMERLARSGATEPVEPHYTALDCYNVEVYPHAFLGSAGRRTGAYYAGVDDLSIISPKFDTDILLEIPALTVKKQGSFFSIAYNDRAFQHDFFNDDPLGGYGAGYHSLKRFRNDNAPLDLKVMCIGNSFSNTSLVYLSLAVKALDLLNMQWTVEGDFKTYYADFQPDICIMLTYANSDYDPNNTYDFFGDL
jgi:hypothetical protein